MAATDPRNSRPSSTLSPRRRRLHSTFAEDAIALTTITIAGARGTVRSHRTAAAGSAVGPRNDASAAHACTRLVTTVPHGGQGSLACRRARRRSWRLLQLEVPHSVQPMLNFNMKRDQSSGDLPALLRPRSAHRPALKVGCCMAARALASRGGVLVLTSSWTSIRCHKDARCALSSGVLRVHALLAQHHSGWVRFCYKSGMDLV